MQEDSNPESNFSNDENCFDQLSLNSDIVSPNVRVLDLRLTTFGHDFGQPDLQNATKR